MIFQKQQLKKIKKKVKNSENKENCLEIKKVLDETEVKKNKQNEQMEEINKTAFSSIPKEIDAKPSNQLTKTQNFTPYNFYECYEKLSPTLNKKLLTQDRLADLRKIAMNAIREHKTFTIRGYFGAIRRALMSRGWVEKINTHRKNSSTHGVCQITEEDIIKSLPERTTGEIQQLYIQRCERIILSRYLEHIAVDFLWTSRPDKNDRLEQTKNPEMIVSKLHGVPFTSKGGICTQLKEFCWYHEKDVSELLFPRCYNAWYPQEYTEFLDDFRLTACISFLKWIVDNSIDDVGSNMFSETAKIPMTAVDFAFQRCKEFTDFCKHFDIDYYEKTHVSEYDWEIFLDHHSSLTTSANIIQIDLRKPRKPILLKIKNILNEIQQYWPQFNLDGYLNMWIIKPANKCRGRGIKLLNQLKKIISIVSPSAAIKSHYVVQKYIERPLIIYDTKFDIRQWFLITSGQPLIIWMYKESYLRFSSKIYNLMSNHESVHLTNHAVQKKYKNAERHNSLPKDNMWDCYMFQEYLKKIGKPKMWSERIYPGMRKAIIGAMLASQDKMTKSSNTFELFGADFLIAEDFNPWLLEINACPDLSASTTVTSKMCPQCLHDVIKVVIDYRLDPKADTGNFVLIYRQNIPIIPAYIGFSLTVKGDGLLSKNSDKQPIERLKFDQKQIYRNSLKVLRPISPQNHPIKYKIPISSKQKDVFDKTMTYPPPITFERNADHAQMDFFKSNLIRTLTIPEILPRSSTNSHSSRHQNFCELNSRRRKQYNSKNLKDNSKFSSNSLLRCRSCCAKFLNADEKILMNKNEKIECIGSKYDLF